MTTPEAAVSLGVEESTLVRILRSGCVVAPSSVEYRDGQHWWTRGQVQAVRRYLALHPPRPTCHRCHGFGFDARERPTWLPSRGVLACPACGRGGK